MFCGHVNFFIASFWGRNYFPLKSYLVTFSDNEIINFSEIPKSIFNLAGYQTIIGSLVPYKIIDDLFFTLLCTTLVVLFFIGYKIIKSTKVNQTEIVKWSILFSVLMVISLPSHSSDLYGYIARGAQQTLYGHNPYLQTVDEIKDYSTKTLFFNFQWPFQPTLYGPIFIYITKAIVFLSNNDFFISYINFKLLNLTVFFLLVLFVLKSSEPSDVYLIAWNPLILIHGLWNCHNDLLSGALLFFSFYLLKKKNYFWGLFCLPVIAGIKFVSLLVIPFVFLYLLKNNFKGSNVILTSILGFCSGLIFVFIFSIDYLTLAQGIELGKISKIISEMGSPHRSFIATIYTLTKYFCRWQDIGCDLPLIMKSLKRFSYLLFGLFYFYVLLRKKSNLVHSVVLILFVFFGFTIAKFNSWYLLNIVVFIPLLEKGTLKDLLVMLSMTHTYALMFFDQAKILNFISMTLLPTLYVLFRRKGK